MPIISTTSSGEPDLIFDVYDKLEENELTHYKKHLGELQDLALKHEMDHVAMDFVFERGILLPIIKRIFVKKNINFIFMETIGASEFEMKHLGYNIVN